MKHWNLTTLLLKQKYKNLNVKIIITLPSLFLISKMLIISSRPKNQIQPNTNSGLVSFSILQPTNLIFQTKKEKKDPVQSFPKPKRIKSTKRIKILNEMSSKNTYDLLLASLYFLLYEHCLSLHKKCPYLELFWSVFSPNAEKYGPK